MNFKENGFIKGRIKSFRYTFRGAFLLLKTEHSIMVQATICAVFVLIGFWIGLSRVEWIMQLFAIGLILTAESLNTAIEKLCDFVHPDYNEKIGFIKDISSGAMTFAVVASLLISLLIYYPYIV
nr:diacylglycerol kinase family protein [uncultured Draconibacterium sp.]